MLWRRGQAVLPKGKAAQQAGHEDTKGIPTWHLPTRNRASP